VERAKEKAKEKGKEKEKKKEKEKERAKVSICACIVVFRLGVLLWLVSCLALACVWSFLILILVCFLRPLFLV
jgi:hypothetical protein